MWIRGKFLKDHGVMIMERADRQHREDNKTASAVHQCPLPARECRYSDVVLMTCHIAWIPHSFIYPYFKNKIQYEKQRETFDEPQLFQKLKLAFTALGIQIRDEYPYFPYLWLSQMLPLEIFP